MSRDAEPRRRRSALAVMRSARTRAILSLGIVLGLGSVSTMAFWTDDATMTTGSFQSGTLDVALNGNLGNQNGGTWNNATLAATNLVPGESIARQVAVQNVGTTPFTYTATATATGALATGGALNPVPPATQRLQFVVHVNSTASNTGDQANNNRAGTCTGSAAFSGVLGSSSTTVISSAQTLSASGAQNVCIRVLLPTAAANNLQNQTASATFVFNAKQVGAP